VSLAAKAIMKVGNSPAALRGGSPEYVTSVPAVDHRLATGLLRECPLARSGLPAQPGGQGQPV
jgi:hypothetical protein